MEAVENSNLVNLSGDYVSLARGLVHGRCTLGYSATIPALSSSPPTMTQFQELLLNSAQWNMFENYAVVGQSVYTENRRLRGTGTYIPHMDSTSFRERSSRRRLENLMREPSRGSQRNRDSHIQTSDTFYPGPSQNDNTQGNDVEGRTPENSINLNSEYDFPPLN
ncbi:hypothetical protein POM88_040409 [Heracleum sosnowskyi]|uniref:Uncharacterized protein n=1 Tax=Heracleum sosnowskyi TaxID=360622 RepID=A0AAD8MAB2_9APIA|nr:hypothetical protein POM88_040409 [Heracleum sosnowskyi]